MPVMWTEEQRRVIEVRNKDVLVSAAAGSGKTAVLVERILSRITDPVHPVDIDRLLVVTFTNAAAAEMRERIRDALEQRALEEPDNVHLQKQLVLVHHASITTIHSFCLQVLRSHFHTIGLDPGFRIADEGECRLLEQDTAGEVLDEAYERGEPEFHEFLECVATGKSDILVEELILQLHHFSLAHPWPGEWLEACCRMYDPLFEDSRPWLEFLVQDVHRVLEDMLGELREAVRIAEEPDGPYPYLKTFESDRQLLEGLAAGQDYDSLAAAFRNMGSFARLAAVRDKTISEEKKQRAQEIRNQIKKEVGDIRDRYFYTSPEILWKEFYESGKIVRMLAKLTKRFGERLAEKKAEKNQLDFSDLEHFALEILLKREDGKAVPTPAAREYAEVFEEIMIDEYQDSNLVQELILNSVAGAGRGSHNRFMVGDVKQSIYRFRLARPELFMEKYRRYARPEDENCCRIDLHKNFRSRAEVLDGVNYIFRQIMTEGIGGIEYDSDAALYPGAQFEAGADPDFLPVEVLLLDRSADAGGAARSDGSGTGNMASSKKMAQTAAGKQEEEAVLVGQRILEIVGREEVWDQEHGVYRPAEWRDVVILLRTVSGWAETFREVLQDMGIPCFTGSRTGYFSAAEVRVVLSYLQILDNPVQDIPLAAVLRSPIGGFADEELAIIRARTEEYHFYDCCRKFMEQNENPSGESEGAECSAGQEIHSEEFAGDGNAPFPGNHSGESARDENGPFLGNRSGKSGEPREQDTAGKVPEGENENPSAVEEIRRKLRAFFDTYEYLRAKTTHTPVHLLLWEILDVTGYGAYASALPAGAQRKANLDMLVEKAIAYEASSYRGLYHFVRYIESLKKYEIDYGEAGISGEAENTVRIMSIHKSKGLEFPIVFVSGISKNFNVTDVRGSMVMHPELGIGCDFVDPDRRLKTPNLLKRVIQRRLLQENLGEELRVLYVAMTRAKEKLILTGTADDFEKELQSCWSMDGRQERALSCTRIASASSYLDWILPALWRHPDAACWSGREEEAGFSELSRFRCVCMDSDAQRMQNLISENLEARRLKALLEMDLSVCCDEKTADYLERTFRAEYPYEKDREICGKVSVSELKRMAQTEDEEAEQLYGQQAGQFGGKKEEQAEVVPLVPAFREGTVLTGAARGTAYHVFMQNLDFSLEEPVEIQLEELIKCGKMTPEEGSSLNLDEIRAFLVSDVGQRMARAAGAGMLFREQPFVMGVPADKIREGWNPRETVLVQGIIDAFFYEEDGKIVLLDYKTDDVRSPRVLAEKYRPQLACYAAALGRLTGHKVKRRVIYSFCLGREIIV